MSFSRKKKHTPSNSAPAIGLASHSQPVCPWAAHPPAGHLPSPSPRYSIHAISKTATATGELFLFGGHPQGFYSNDVYSFSTRDFSTTLLQTSGETPGPCQGRCVALTGTHLLVRGGWALFSRENVQFQGHDDSLYLLNLGMSDLLMVRSAPADQSFLCSRIAIVDPRRGQWSRSRGPWPPYHDFGWIQSLRLRWPDPWTREGFK